MSYVLVNGKRVTLNMSFITAQYWAEEYVTVHPNSEVAIVDSTAYDTPGRRARALATPLVTLPRLTSR